MSLDTTTAAITATSTLCVALIGAVVAGRIQASREKTNWIRDRRLDAYSLFSSAGAELFSTLRAVRTAETDANKDAYSQALLHFHDAFRLVNIVGPAPVRAIAEAEADLFRDTDDPNLDRSLLLSKLDETKKLRAAFSESASRVLGFD